MSVNCQDTTYDCVSKLSGYYIRHVSKLSYEGDTYTYLGVGSKVGHLLLTQQSLAHFNNVTTFLRRLLHLASKEEAG